MSKNIVDSLDRPKAVLLFVRKLIRHSLKGSGRDTERLLAQGPTWPSPSRRDVELHEWYVELSRADRNRVQQVINEAASAAIFHTLTVFDGVAGSLVDGLHTELSIELRVYAGPEAVQARLPAISIVLNPRGVAADELHDVYQAELNTGTRS